MSNRPLVIRSKRKAFLEAVGVGGAGAVQVCWEFQDSDKFIQGMHIRHIKGGYTSYVRLHAALKNTASKPSVKLFLHCSCYTAI